jgi:adenosylcobyric acid synthase
MRGEPISLAPCLMIQGTASGVGKSVLTAALCRLFARAGYRVAPFKSQNMALNAAVTPDGREIGRAQAAQAEAAGVEPTVDMNPILLKPEGEDRSQVVVGGVSRGSFDFKEYGAMRAQLLPIVEASLGRLRRAYDLVVIEGAGSPAEINLNDGEIVNMRIARMAGAPVILVGDIDRGGVFAAFVGTLALLEPDDRDRVKAFLINKFRGDISLLTSGLDMLTRRTGRPVLGVVPYLDDVPVAAEDSLDLDGRGTGRSIEERHGFAGVLGALGDMGGHLGAPHVADIQIAVVRLPRIANFDDFEPLAREPRVRVRFVRRAVELGAADLVILPGSKNTIADLAWLRATGFAEAIVTAEAQNQLVLGICGGYQMLGKTLHDPLGVESTAGETAGLGFLPTVTTFASEKTTVRVRARVEASAGPFAGARGLEVEAYEIHMGVTRVPGGDRLFTVTRRNAAATDEADGVMNARGTVVGTYLHGLFASDGLRRALLVHLAERKRQAPDPRWGTLVGADRYDRLADVVGGALDLAFLARLARVDPRRLSSS